MNREEAITIIQLYKEELSNSTDFGDIGMRALMSMQINAFELAIEALQAPTNDDLIRREDAINKFKAHWYYGKSEVEFNSEDIEAIHDALKSIPSASRPKPTGDLISREDAIKAVEQEYRVDWGYMADDYTYGFNQAIQYVSDFILQDLPSAEYSEPLQTILNSDLISREDAIEVIQNEDNT